MRDDLNTKHHYAVKFNAKGKSWCHERDFSDFEEAQKIYNEILDTEIYDWVELIERTTTSVQLASHKK